MRIPKLFFSACLAAGQVFAGALTVSITHPAGNPGAVEQGAVLVAATTACISPGKTILKATAEALVDGRRKSIPLTLVALPAPGTFALTRQWPETGSWVVAITATNPDYPNYATGALIRVDGSLLDWAHVGHVFHAPETADIDALLARAKPAGGTSGSGNVARGKL